MLLNFCSMIILIWKIICYHTLVLDIDHWPYLLARLDFYISQHTMLWVICRIILCTTLLVFLFHQVLRTWWIFWSLWVIPRGEAVFLHILLAGSLVAKTWSKVFSFVILQQEHICSTWTPNLWRVSYNGSLFLSSFHIRKEMLKGSPLAQIWVNSVVVLLLCLSAWKVDAHENCPFGLRHHIALSLVGMISLSMLMISVTKWSGITSLRAYISQLCSWKKFLTLILPGFTDWLTWW